MPDVNDNCQTGELGWTSTLANDYDTDGCRDLTEDPDDDNDGTDDMSDSFPLDPMESEDSDSDGIGNNADKNIDGDSARDRVDTFPLDPTETSDTDGDQIGDNADTDIDTDGDAFDDGIDAFPVMRSSSGEEVKGYKEI